MSIKILHSKGKTAMVVIDINILLSIVNLEELKKIQGSESLLEEFHNQSKELALDDIENYNTFEDWNQKLISMDGRDPSEFLPDYGMTLGEYRKLIWNAEKNLHKAIPFKVFQKKWKKKKISN